MGTWRKWKPGNCLICALHRLPGLTFPPPRRVFWHQHGMPPVCLDYPDPSDVYEDERERWDDVFDWDDAHDLEPVEMPHYNRQHRKRRRV